MLCRTLRILTTCLVKLIKVTFFRVFVQKIGAVVLYILFAMIVVSLGDLGAILLHIYCHWRALVISATISRALNWLCGQIACNVSLVLHGSAAQLRLSLLAAPIITWRGCCCKVLGIYLWWDSLSRCRLVILLPCLISIHLKLLSFECLILNVFIAPTLSATWTYIFAPTFSSFQSL
jgi:hypothetical protein